MPELIVDKEAKMLRKLAGSFTRHDRQVNNLLESDAEIIDIKNTEFNYLVLKTDGIQEEISTKLYEDPFTIGWMSVTATMSDLAAVGSQPMGLLLNLQLPQYDDAWMKQFQRGINEACIEYNVSVLGGDTNYNASLSVSTTGIGTIKDGRPLLRKNMQPGDLLYSTGKLGLGNAFAYSVFFDDDINMHYQPVARLKESKIIKDFATGCMDTSDGLFPALSVLSEINSVGFHLIPFLQDIIHEDALEILDSTNIPHWMFLAGPHGEYELIFTIPPLKQEAFEKATRLQDWTPVFLGKIIPGNKVSFDSAANHIECQPAVIANLYNESNGDINYYFELLKKQHAIFTKI